MRVASRRFSLVRSVYSSRRLASDTENFLARGSKAAVRSSRSVSPDRFSRFNTSDRGPSEDRSSRRYRSDLNTDIFRISSSLSFSEINYIVSIDIFSLNRRTVSLSFSIRLAEFPHTSTADDFLMAALTTTDEVASSLCSNNVRWGICIANTANPMPTAPTVGRARCAQLLARGPAAASRIRAVCVRQRLSNQPLIPNSAKYCDANRNLARFAMRTERYPLIIYI